MHCEMMARNGRGKAQQREHSEELFVEATGSFLEHWGDIVVLGKSRVTWVGILSLTFMTYETVSDLLDLSKPVLL